MKNIFSKIFYITLILTITCVIGIQGCTASSSNLKFAQVSDVHFSSFEKDTQYKVLSSSSLILDDVVNQINNTSDIDFTMFTGDMINQPLKKELMLFINHANLLNRPWYVVFGNHDTTYHGELNKELFFDILNGHNKNFCSKKTYYSYIPKKNYKVIGLDTIITERRTSQGYISEEQLQWLKDELDCSKGDIIIIFTHVPVIEPFPSENHRLLNSYDLKLLLKKYDNPIIICSGHYHATKIFQEDNILYINTPSLVSYPNAFRIINISPKRNKVIVDVYLKETRLKEFQTKSKNNMLGGMLLYGSETDRNNTFELPKKRDMDSF